MFFLKVKIIANYDLIEIVALTTNPYGNKKTQNWIPNGHLKIYLLTFFFYIKKINKEKWENLHNLFLNKEKTHFKNRNFFIYIIS